MVTKIKQETTKKAVADKVSKLKDSFDDLARRMSKLGLITREHIGIVEERSQYLFFSSRAMYKFLCEHHGLTEEKFLAYIQEAQSEYKAELLEDKKSKMKHPEIICENCLHIFPSIDIPEECPNEDCKHKVLWQAPKTEEGEQS